MANGGDDSRALQEFRRNFFGISREHAPMPESYLRELQRLVGAASAQSVVLLPGPGGAVAACRTRDSGRPGCFAPVVRVIG